jgi:hypothetical protein
MSAVVDATTLDRKLMMGYQGWFLSPGDGSPVNGWKHWFSDNKTSDALHLTVDMWPDMRELPPDECHATNMRFSDGRVATLYSAYNPATVARHFKWMQEYNLDGVMLQRFVNELNDPAARNFRDQVAKNSQDAAEAHGRVFCMMYDITGSNATTVVHDLQTDWTHLVDDLKVTQSPRYLRHKGKPLLAIWGLGFTNNDTTAVQAQEIVRYFKTSAASNYQVTLMGGVPPGWRTLDSDSKTDPAWTGVYRSFAVLSPWSVGRFENDKRADDFRKRRILPDKAEASRLGIDYMPVVFPGFSYRNGSKGIKPLNEIPRRGGDFWWHQLHNVVSAGCTMIYGAMFDEVDEGTAMFKLAADKQDLPTQAHDRLVYLNIDGEIFRSDWYLQVADQGGKMLRGEIKLTRSLSIKPGVI